MAHKRPESALSYLKVKVHVNSFVPELTSCFVKFIPKYM